METGSAVIEARYMSGGGIGINLSGEVDIQCLAALRETLEVALRSRHPVFVDLSGVTFLDTLCIRELVVQYQLHTDRLALYGPSAEVELTVAACELEGWLDFYPDLDAALRALRTGVEQRLLGEPGQDLEKCRMAYESSDE